MFRVVSFLAAGAASLLLAMAPAKAVEVYLFKGAGDFSMIHENMHFSRGLNEMAEQLNAEGIHAEVRRFGQTEDAMRAIRQRKPETVAFIGHSMGALASLSMARRMRAEGIRVVYLGLIDIPGPVGVAGDNVEWAENYYSIPPVYGLLTNASSHPNAQNIHVPGYIHNRMDDSPKVQKGMLDAIRKVHAAEQNEFGEPAETLHVNAEDAVPATPQTAPALAAAEPQYQPPQPETTTFQAATAYQSAAGSEPLLQPEILPSVLPPEPIPNVSAGQSELGQTETYAQPLPQTVDPVTTASTSRGGGILETGRDLIGKVGNMISRLGSNAPREPQPANRMIDR